MNRPNWNPWMWAYQLEEAREAYASEAHYLRSAACCLGLALLRCIWR